ncbi:LysM peptidoglycan-binding domain-containing protein [Geomonas subterranea]|uniref:LysM peptidoglycan-binding domain-containing protein n=1 Tax=Geomonas subterranea TaxID=2847989 RepID=A0ABX8LBC6_9BACT|nr:LysM peptidoglycan-binding domain-containing protein [Geomonas subterranea]QXE89315.1 LysM peptidoglycan-binding domain-containing protein [Geomonas subterranea]QXM08571.1 LysM peptidoglycan-binding domain-containing protein [Geomonas subterranea]
MANRRIVTLGTLLSLACGTAGHAEEMLLYTPKETTGADAPASPREGVLVRTVTVKRGDTLAKLSRKHIGVSDYFPQMLVFNRIKNPDLIHPGEKLLVPVPPGRPGKTKTRSSHAGRRTAAKQATPGESTPAKPGEQDLFQMGQRAYLGHDYREALARFNDFLRAFPRSRFAADASLYRADCFLHLSGE